MFYDLFKSILMSVSKILFPRELSEYNLVCIELHASISATIFQLGKVMAHKVL